jgi:type II secretory pathway pseudopilin PulG
LIELVKVKPLKRHRALAVPKMTIRSHLPWPIKLILSSIVLGICAALAMWTYELGRGITGQKFDAERAQLETLKEQLESLRTEHDQFSSAANAAESQLTIERSAAKQLATQMRALQAENNKLKEDLAFFEKLLPTSTGPQGVSIQQLKIENIGPNQLKYHLLLMQGGKGTEQFVGNLQLAISVMHEGKSVKIIFPERNSAELERDKFKLAFKHYQRIEGMLALPEGAVAEHVEVRVLEKGQIRAQQSANL